VLWDDDFAAARNRALAEASGAWILALDADEVIAREDAGRLRQLLRAPGKAAFTFVTRNYVQSADVQGWVRNDGTYSEEAGTGWVPSAKVRLFTSDPRIRWEGKVHESVEPAIRAAGIPVETCDIPIHHYGKMDRERTRRKGEMYRDVSLRAVENGNQILRTLVELARQESELGHHPEALEWWHQVLAKDPEHSEALAGMGGVLAVLGRFSDALEPLTRAINRDSTKKEAGVHLALVKLHLGDPAGARAAAGRVCTHYPEYPFALAALAAARFCLGEKDAGLELLGRLRAAQVNYTGFFLDLASRLTRSGRADYAVRFLETLVEADGPTPELAAVLVDSYRTLVTGAE
jgi:Tfp pilus assembly protein PilF